jgi:hypothetical protein
MVREAKSRERENYVDSVVTEALDRWRDEWTRKQAGQQILGFKSCARDFYVLVRVVHRGRNSVLGGGN